MELKVVCECGQKFKFDVEPVNGQMPFAVNCPICNADGTAAANALIAAQVATAPPTAAPAKSRLRINVSTPEPAAAVPAEETSSDHPVPPRPGAFRQAAAAAALNPPKATSFGKGLLGGLVGALVGSIVYLLVFKYSGYQIKLLAIGVGALAGWLADFLGKGEGSKELGGITAVFVLAGIIGAQYFVALGWWHEFTESELKEAAALYATTVSEAKAVVKAVPTGSDAEIRGYLAKLAAKDGEMMTPGKISNEEVKAFRDNELPEYQRLASGKVTQAEFEQKHELKTSLTQTEKQEDENTFKAVFLLLLLNKVNLFSLAAAAGLAFKMSANA